MKHNTMELQVIEDFEQEQAQILQELQELHEALKAEVDTNFGEGDPYLVEQGTIIARIQECERQLRGLERTLEQARRGRYGICEQCQKPIDPARLQALPDTTLCIECKRTFERKHHIDTR